MNVFEKILSNLEGQKPSHIVGVAFELNKEKIVNLVKIQLSKTIDGEGNHIGYYAHTYEIEPEYGDNPRGFPKEEGEPYNLLWTGTFENTMVGIVKNNTIFVKADGKLGKDEDIIDKYGLEIIGFTNESIGQVPEIIKPDIIKIILNHIRNF